MMRHIWNIFARAGSLWIAWVKKYILKGKSFWQVKILQVCSWSWRKLTSPNPNGVLYDQYGHRAVYDSGSKVGKNCLPYWERKCGVGCWPPARSEDLVRTQSKLLEVKTGEKDQLLRNWWKKGQHTCSETREAIRFKLPNVIW